MALPGSSVNNPVWKILWKMELPSKIKIFVWRAFDGIMPLKSIMVNRHVGTSGECPICHLDAEDIHHLLFKCLHATELWGILGLSDSINDSLVVDRFGSVILEYIILRQNSRLPRFQNIGITEIILVAAWYLRWIRRKCTHDEAVAPMHHCRMSILTITSNAAKRRRTPRNSENRWSKPEPRQVKVNVDGSFHENDGSGAVGAILRDYQGRFIAASSIFYPNLASASTAEALAMKEGLALA
jgi:hypothetical protein